MTIASPKRIGALALVAAFAVAACGGGIKPGLPATAARRVAAIVVSGSSTVEPISTGVAELFKQQNPDFNYQIEGPGTGDGFARFCNGETDISDASRAIKDEEAAKCAEAGIEYVELKVAYDGLSVVTNVNNTAIACLSFADIYALVGPESTGFTKWSDGDRDRKRARLQHHPARCRPRDHGPRRGVRHVRLLRRARPRQDRRVPRPGGPDPARLPRARPTTTSSSRASATTRRRSAGSASPSPRRTPTRSARSRSARIPMEPASNRTPQTVSDGSYPISRPLFIYVNKAKAAANAGCRGLRRLLPRRGHDRQGPRDRPLRQPSRRGARRDAGRLGSPLAALLRRDAGRVGSETRPASLHLARLRSREGSRR